MSVCIIGSVAYDSIASPMGSVERVIGGSGTFASLAASIFSQVYLVSIVGRDFTEWGYFNDQSIDITGIEVRSDMDTFHWRGTYEGDLNQAITLQTDINCLAAFNPMIPDVAKRVGWVLLANCDPDVQLSALDGFGGNSQVVMDSMNYWISSKPDKVKAVMKQSTVVILNDAEIRQLTGCDRLVDAMGEVRKWGVPRVIVKKGEYGAMMLGDGGLFSIPSWPVPRVVDPTGAGDTFAGTLVGYMAMKGEITEAGFRQGVVLGSVAASKTIQSFSVNELVGLTAQQLQQEAGLFCNMIDVEAIGVVTER